MNNKKSQVKSWIKIGIICGLIVSVTYPLIILVSIPLQATLILVILCGPMLSLGSAGLYYFISLHKKTITVIIALLSNIIAGTLFTLMLLVQIALRLTKPEVIDATSKWIWKSLNSIHLGLDVGWDIYIFFGTFLFAVSIFNHPKLGKFFSVPGIIISLLMIVFNILTFPVPPAESYLIDLGPLVGLWYLAVTIRIIFSFNWINERIGNTGN
ncbi:hypothetical protein ACFLS9_07930 [Bacteroidota bacterium]